MKTGKKADSQDFDNRPVTFLPGKLPRSLATDACNADGLSGANRQSPTTDFEEDAP